MRPEAVELAPGLAVCPPEDGGELRYHQAAVDQVLNFFSLLVFGQNDWAGKPFELLPWQARLIREFYGVQVKDDDGTWVRYRRFLYNEIPKKNGKSELAAGLGLYHLLADGEKVPNVGIFAVDKQNADIIYQCARYMVEHTALSEPAHRPLAWCRDSVREIRTRFGGVMKVYSGDVENKHGPSAKAERETWVREKLRGKMCCGGLDMSRTTDLTAFVLVFPAQPGLETAVALFQAWRPLEGVLEAEQRDHVPYRDWERAGFLTLCQGDMVDYRDVIEAVLEAKETYGLRMLGVDAHLTATVTPMLQNEGITVVAISQTMTGMSPAMKELERMIHAHEMLHVHNTCARWCFSNVRCAVDGNENMKPMKDRSTGRIDITVAWIIAVAAWMVYKAQNPFDKTKLREDWGL